MTIEQNVRTAQYLPRWAFLIRRNVRAACPGKPVKAWRVRFPAERLRCTVASRTVDLSRPGENQYTNGYAACMDDVGQTSSPMRGRMVEDTDQHAHIPLP
jgi:hypothetical protein